MVNCPYVPACTAAARKETITGLQWKKKELVMPRVLVSNKLHEERARARRDNRRICTLVDRQAPITVQQERGHSHSPNDAVVHVYVRLLTYRRDSPPLISP